MLAGAVARAVEDVQGACPDLGWDEATSLVHLLVDGLAHRLVQLVDAGVDGYAATPPAGSAATSPGGYAAAPAANAHEPAASAGSSVRRSAAADHQADHASCRAAAATLRRTAPTFTDALGQPGDQEAADVATELADLLDRVADLTRTRRLTPSDKGVVLRRLHTLQRRFHDS